MNAIRVLPDTVANKIAAGEVVERPASVVRELVDNSIDAGADEIRVSLIEGGHTAITVSDNGFGMSREDAVMAFERHATSKLREERDLWGISTLGFRGEALPSIAAVSKLTLRTKRAGEAAATEVRFEGGRLLGVDAAAGPTGTTVEVRSLFFNTPARRKFLKSPRSEQQKIKSWLSGLALVHPRVRFVLSADGDEILNLAPRERSIDRGRELMKGSFVDVSRADPTASVEGLVCHPSQALPDARGFSLFVNRRPVSERALVRAAKDGYGAQLKDRQYPTGFLHLTLPGEDVDVNVHPQKSEVRFANGDRLYHIVRSSVARALEGLNLPVAGGAGEVAPGAAFPPVSFPTAAFSAGPQPAATTMELPFVAETPDLPAPELEGAASFRFSKLRYIGQALACYLLCEWEGALVVVDMHAAHERWNYNRILKRLRAREPESQPLLFPTAVELDPDERSNLLEHQPLLERLGFALEFNDAGLNVLALPGLLTGRSAEAFLRETAAIETSIVAGERYARVEEQVASRLACHASVRSGRELEREEVYALFALLDSTECAASCPHGRPVVVSFSAYDIERWFCRV